MDNTPAPTQDTNIPDSDFSSSAPLGTTPSTDLETSSPSNPPPPFEDTSYDVPPPKKSKKSFAALLVVLFLVLALPVAIYVAQHRQEYRQRAAYCLADGNSCGGGTIDCCSGYCNNGSCAPAPGGCVSLGGTCGNGFYCCSGNCNATTSTCVDAGAPTVCPSGSTCKSSCGSGEEVVNNNCDLGGGARGLCCGPITGACVPDYCTPTGCNPPMVLVHDSVFCAGLGNLKCTCGLGGGTPSPTPTPVPNATPLYTCFRCSATNNFCESYLTSSTCSTDCSACTPGGGAPTPSPVPSGFVNPTPTPTPPTPSPTPAPVAQCLNIKAYSVGVVSDPSSWVLLTTTQLQNLQPGQTIYVTVLGSVQNGAVIDKARIRVNSTTWTTANETTNLKPSSQEYYISYTIPVGVNSFVFDAEVHDQATNLWY